MAAGKAEGRGMLDWHGSQAYSTGIMAAGKAEGRDGRQRVAEHSQSWSEKSWTQFEESERSALEQAKDRGRRRGRAAVRKLVV